MGNFVEEQKTINAQLNQRIENVESSMDKRIDGLHKSLNQKIDTLQSSISSLTNRQKVQEQGRFPSQTLTNPRGVHELSYTNEPTQKMDEVQAIITLRSGKEIKQSMPKPAGKTKEQEEMEPEHIITVRFLLLWRRRHYSLVFIHLNFQFIPSMSSSLGFFFYTWHYLGHPFHPLSNLATCVTWVHVVGDFCHITCLSNPFYDTRHPVSRKM